MAAIIIWQYQPKAAAAIIWRPASCGATSQQPYMWRYLLASPSAQPSGALASSRRPLVATGVAMAVYAEITFWHNNNQSIICLNVDLGFALRQRCIKAGICISSSAILLLSQ